MKKLLLILSIFVVSLSAFAAELNPFAYGLYADVNTNPSGSPDCVMGLHWKINAAVTTMKLIIIDENGVEYEYRSYDGRAAGSYGTSVTHSRMAMLGIPYGQELKWRIDVTGAAVANAAKVDKEYYFYRPTSVDTDDNFESPNFGRILCNESYQEIKGKSGTGQAGAYSTYKSYGYGAGLYEFNAHFDFIGAHNGGNAFKVYREDNKNSKDSEKSQAPHRIRIADDGCIFVTSFNGGAAWGGKLLWKVDTATLDTWAPMFGYHSVSSVSQLLTSDGYFIAAPNVGFDVKGEGSTLQMLMLSANSNHVNGYESAFRCYEYDWGNANSWSTAPSRKWFDGNSNNNFNATYKAINHYGTQVQYDNKGGIWMCQHQSESQERYPSLVYYDNNQVARYHEVMDNRAGGGFRFNKDFTRVIISGGNGNVGEATVYTVSNDANGYPVKLTKEFTIPMGLGSNITDYAWDIADNIYAVSYSKEKLVAYALPHAEDKVVSTPAASRYTFTIDCQPGEYYDVQVNTQDVTYGTVGGGGNNIASCETTTVFAQSKDGYRFVCWKEGSTTVSTNNPYTFVVTKDITLTAHFEEGDYNVTWWNLFEEGEDIYEDNDDRNYRVYELFRPLYNTLQKTNRWQQKFTTSDALNSGDKNVLGFCYSDGTVEMLSGDSPMKWLGDYLAYVAKEQGVVNAQNWGWTTWGIHLYGFVNRTKYARNQQGTIYTGLEGLGGMEGLNGFPDYTGEFGLPTKWRPWWTSIECGLPNEMKYSSKMPTQFTKEPATTGYKAEAGETSQVIKGTPSWYVWNYEEDKLLAWRDGGTAITDKIVHHVDRNDMKLYATYVDKTLQEDDPDPTGEYDAKNSDVLSLLANENHGTTDHNITVDRKFVAGMYNTVCFPFDLHRSLFPTKLKDAEVLTFDGVTVTGNEYGEPVAVLNFITLEEYWQKWNDEYPDKQVDLGDPYMEAGVPYLIKPKTDISDDYLTYSGLKYWKFFNGEKEPYSIHHNGVTFQGVLNPTILPEDACILVADNRLAKVTGTGEDRKIKGYRGYFVIDNIAISQMAEEGNVYFSFNKPVTTSVPLAPEAEQPKKTKVRKVMYDGQIYILRGDEVYTITGNRVK